MRLGKEEKAMEKEANEPGEEEAKDSKSHAPEENEANDSKGQEKSKKVKASRKKRDPENANEKKVESIFFTI